MRASLETAQAEAQRATEDGRYDCGPGCRFFNNHRRVSGDELTRTGEYPELMAFQFLAWAEIYRRSLLQLHAADNEDGDEAFYDTSEWFGR